MASITFNKPGKMASEIEIDAFNDPPLYDTDEEDFVQKTRKMLKMVVRIWPLQSLLTMAKLVK